MPQVPSQHERLLAEVDHLPQRSWSARALRTVLRNVRAHAGIEDIAIADAWVEDEETFCLVYTPPWGPQLAGTRRQRGDLDPVAQLAPLHDGAIAFETPTHPDDYGAMLLDDISQPLGRMSERLRYDTRGIGWWGTLTETLPERPA